MENDYCPFRGEGCHSICTFLQDGRCLLRAAAEKFLHMSEEFDAALLTLERSWRAWEEAQLRGVPEPTTAALASGVVVPAATNPKRRPGRPRKAVAANE